MASTNSNYVLFGVDFGSNQGQRELIRQINEDCQRKPVVYCRGAAGTGKTFAALAASLSLVRGKGAKKKYKNIYYVREPVEIGHRLGYLKGTEEDKYAPYLGPLLDNYNHLMAKGRKAGAVPDNIRQPKKIKAKMDDEEMEAQPYQRLPSDIIPLAPEFLRGRSFENCIIIVDEAQNLTPKQAKGIITRAGMGTKIILLGDPQQIDHPLLDERTNGLSYAAEKMKGSPLCWQVTMSAEECERSALAMDAVKRM